MRAGWSGLACSWLDVKLGMRMMRKFPGVSLVIVFALAVGIPVSLVPNHLFDAATAEPPPFDQGERVLGVVGLGPDGVTDLRLGDYELLRARLKTFAPLGAVIPLELNVIAGDSGAAGERGALMSASSFVLSRVQPIKGRALLPADELKGAPDVAVVGYAFWRRRLGGAENVVGTTIRVAGVPTTIVGVMPEGFAMPSTEQMWLPLRLRALDYQDRSGPVVWVYGRLADGASDAQARAELKAITLPAVPGVRPSPLPADAVAFSTVEVREPRGATIQLLLGMAQVVPVIILLIACGNASILILARTASRTGEVALRTVLGASRQRIMGQFFVEALLLALLATGLGLIALQIAMTRLVPPITLPFWFDPGMTPLFALKALGVSVHCAVVAGVLPAARVTAGSLPQTIQAAGTGGGTLRFGRVAGALIVIEVALGTAALFGGIVIWNVFQPNPDAYTRAAEADRYLVATVRLPESRVDAGPADDGNEARRIRLARLQNELGRRLASEGAVRRWTFSDQPPGEEADERLVRVEGDGLAPEDRGLPGVRTAVDPSFFALLNVSPVSGRLFTAADVPINPSVEPTAVIVNVKFLERRGMDPARAIGKRVRFTTGTGEAAAWKEIVGVVPNIEPSEDRVFADGTPVVFAPAMPGTFHPMTVTIDLGSTPLAFAGRLRSLVADTDPTVVVDEVAALDQLPGEVNVFRIGLGVMSGLAVLAMALATTALYALMSMTAAQRRREIGIRIALGGTAREVMMTVARRALVQIGVGVTLGAGAWVVLLSSTQGEIERVLTGWPLILAAAAVVVVTIGLLAALGPTLKYVRMRPLETLRTD